MKTIEELRPQTVDRSNWTPGPWDSEPDFRQWRDETTGLPCLIVRNRHGAWCGYVGVSAGHPLFEKDCNAAEDISVHGGLTYADHCAGGICHTVEAGEDDNVFWFGFDCMHGFDLAPGMEADRKKLGLPGLRSSGLECGETYRDMDYVTGECQSLASQLATIDSEAKVAELHQAF